MERDSSSDTPDPGAKLYELVAPYLDDRLGLTELSASLADHIEWVIAGPPSEAPLSPSSSRSN